MSKTHLSDAGIATLLILGGTHLLQWRGWCLIYNLLLKITFQIFSLDLDLYMFLQGLPGIHFVPDCRGKLPILYLEMKWGASNLSYFFQSKNMDDHPNNKS